MVEKVNGGFQAFDPLGNTVSSMVRWSEEKVAKVFSRLDKGDLRLGAAPVVNDALPKIPSPSDAAQSMIGKDGFFVGYVMTAISLLGKVTVEELEQMVANWRALMKSEKDASDKLSMKFNKAVADSEAAIADFKKKDAAYQADLKDESDKKATFDKASDELKKAEPSASNYGKLKDDKDKAEREWNAAKDKSKNSGTEQANAYAEMSRQMKSTQDLSHKVVTKDGNWSDYRDSQTRNLNNLGIMVKIIAEMTKRLGEDGVKSLGTDLEIFKQIQEARIKEMDKKASDLEEKENTSKALGCLGKIFGYLLAAVAVVGAVFTGGASLALAVIGLGLMVVDEVVKAATGKSFLGEAVSYLYDKLIKPLADLIGKAITSSLMALGVDKKTAEIIGNVVGTILAIIAVAAMMVLAKAGGQALASKMEGSMISVMIKEAAKFMERALENVTGKAGQKVSNSVTKLREFFTGHKQGTDGFDKAVLQGEKYANRAQFVVGGVDAGFSIAKGVTDMLKEQDLAVITLLRSEMELLSQLMSQVVERISKDFKVEERMANLNSRLIETNYSTGVAILGQMKL